MILAHGAGAPMDTPFMTAFAVGLAKAGLRVIRFEFPYMAERRTTGRRRGPGRADRLTGYFEQIVHETDRPGAIVVGGKSMGGRVASLIADGIAARGLVCLGYPFHPPGKPETLRVEHLLTMRTPALIVQGERDPFGLPDEIDSYALPSSIQVCTLKDGDHSLKPRKASGLTIQQNWARAVAEVVSFCHGL